MSTEFTNEELDAIGAALEPLYVDAIGADRVGQKRSAYIVIGVHELNSGEGVNISKAFVRDAQDRDAMARLKEVMKPVPTADAVKVVSEISYAALVIRAIAAGITEGLEEWTHEGMEFATAMQFAQQLFGLLEGESPTLTDGGALTEDEVKALMGGDPQGNA